jgi:hypothetical protein
MEYDSLFAEVTELKNLLISHTCCNDPIIDSWIRSEARRFVENL